MVNKARDSREKEEQIIVEEVRGNEVRESRECEVQ